MPLILSSNPMSVDRKTPSGREAKFGRQRFLKEQKLVCAALGTLYIQSQADFCSRHSSLDKAPVLA
jgi:hypothetical protein